MADDMQGVVETLAITPELIPSTSLEEVEATLEGLVGDKHFGLTMKANKFQAPYSKGELIRNVRQISIVSAEELAQVAAAMGVERVEPAWLGANLMISGVPELTQLPPGSRLYFEGGAGVVVEGENMPCVTAGGCLAEQYERPELRSAFPKRAIGKRGLVAWVEKPGVIRKGERVTVRRAEDVGR
ncbi:MAG: MOSC domain-containing protein [Anaerolineales bacterium]|nr:MAG: MOSC domain-containing protein [Anaerolineales bacterium]